MKRLQLFMLSLSIIFTACSPVDHQGTIAELRNREMVINDEKVTGGLENAMESYQRFLEEAQDSPIAPEAIRRLADLKVEKEYGFISEGEANTSVAIMTTPEPANRPNVPTPDVPSMKGLDHLESEADFERRTTDGPSVLADSMVGPGADQAIADLEKTGPLEAIALYRKLLNEYPLYDRNDQVLYQMSRAYEELGRIEEAMTVMEQLVREFPQSRYLDEVQFRRAEYFFSHRRYLDAEDSYKNIVNLGVASTFYPLALYKLGWTFYKQELYEEALHNFIAVLDYNVSVGYDFEQTENEPERKRIEDTFRVISLSFSYLGGADTVVDYFSRYGRRDYEDSVYRNLGEYYFTKRRYSDAVATYNAYLSRNPFHSKAPLFQMRIIEINTAGGFPTLVVESKKAFATHYGLTAEYWQYFDPGERQDVIAYLKINLTDLANHYHALYQNPKRVEEQPVNLAEALHWYRQFLVSFPHEEESPVINYQLADLLLENRSFAEAAIEYEKTAYTYELHEQSSKAGYAAVYAYRQQLELVAQTDRDPVRREVVRSSLLFAETFPTHDKAAVVLGAAADDLYGMGDHAPALAAAQLLIETFPGADVNVLRSAWLVVAHASYELELYREAESAYVEVLALLPEGDESRTQLFDNLAAAIYKQGEQANALEDYALAADHFLRVGTLAPTSAIRPTAEYDAATALILLKDWEKAARVLTSFRDNFSGHALQADVTKKIAYVYRQDGKLSQAADEYERIERESDDDAIRQEALLVALELHEQAGSLNRVLEVGRRYVDYFPQPVGIHLETRSKIAEILEKQQKRQEYLNELKQIVAIDAAAGNERTDRTRFLAAKAGLVLAQASYEQFEAVKLVKPFDVNLRKKKEKMKTTVQEFSRLIDYEIGEVTAAATFYLAEIYAHFSKALMDSERPGGLSPLEMEEYELAIEEQAYPFEEKAIEVHESNLALISLGVYNTWIDKSLAKLAVFVPARYAKPEEETEIITSLEAYSFSAGTKSPVAAFVEEGPTAAGQAEDIVKKDVVPAAVMK